MSSLCVYFSNDGSHGAVVTDSSTKFSAEVKGEELKEGSSVYREYKTWTIDDEGRDKVVWEKWQGTVVFQSGITRCQSVEKTLNNLIEDFKKERKTKKEVLEALLELGNQENVATVGRRGTSGRMVEAIKELQPVKVDSQTKKRKTSAVNQDQPPPKKAQIQKTTLPAEEDGTISNKKENNSKKKQGKKPKVEEPGAKSKKLEAISKELEVSRLEKQLVSWTSDDSDQQPILPPASLERGSSVNAVGFNSATETLSSAVPSPSSGSPDKVCTETKSVAPSSSSPGSPHKVLDATMSNPQLDDLSTSLNTSINIMYDSYVEDPVEVTSAVEKNHCHHCFHLQQQVMSLHNTVQCLWQDMHILKGAQYSYMYAPTENLQPAVALTSAQSAQYDPSPSDSNMALTTNAQASASSNQNDHQFPLYNGFSKEQLACKIQHRKKFGAATKVLVRSLYSNEELQNMSATGSKGKPAIDQRRRHVLVEIIQEKFNHISEAAVNRKIADILKPSGHKAH